MPRPSATTTSPPSPGWVLPGLVDAHSHIGLGAHGAVDDATAEEQALADRDAGALLLRDAGSPAETRWVQEREDLPRLVRAGRHIARTKRYIRNYAWEVEPEDLVAQVRLEARAGDGWVKLVGDWIDRDSGDLEPCWPADVLAEAVAAAHEEGARVTAHCFGEQSLRDLAAAGTDCVEHATGLLDDTVASFAAQGIAIVPTLVNIDTFPRIVAPAAEKFPDYHRHMLDLHERRVRHRRGGPRRRHPRLRRHGCRGLARARPRRDRGRPAGAGRAHAGRGARRRLLGCPRLARVARAGGGRRGRPRRLPARPARGPRRARGARRASCSAAAPSPDRTPDLPRVRNGCPGDHLRTHGEIASPSTPRHPPSHIARHKVRLFDR